MNTTDNVKKALFVALLAMTISTADAHRRPVRHHVVHRTTAVTSPVVISSTLNSLNRADRLKLALAYIDRNGGITAKQYAKLTGLSKSTAEAELDSFATDRRPQLAISQRRSKWVYVRTNR